MRRYNTARPTEQLNHSDPLNCLLGSCQDEWDKNDNSLNHSQQSHKWQSLPSTVLQDGCHWDGHGSSRQPPWREACITGLAVWPCCFCCCSRSSCLPQRSRAQPAVPLQPPARPTTTSCSKPLLARLLLMAWPPGSPPSWCCCLPSSFHWRQLATRLPQHS